MFNLINMERKGNDWLGYFLGPNTDDFLKSYIDRHDLSNVIKTWCENPSKRYNDIEITENQRRQFKRLQKLGTANRVTETVSDLDIGKNNLPGAENYFWVFTPERTNIEILMGDQEEKDTIGILLKDIDPRSIRDPGFARRILTVRNRIYSLRGLTKEQAEQIDAFSRTIYLMAQKGVDETGKRVDPSEIVPLFEGYLREIGIGTSRGGEVYKPSKHPGKRTGAQIRKEMDDFESLWENRRLEDIRKKELEEQIETDRQKEIQRQKELVAQLELDRAQMVEKRKAEAAKRPYLEKIKKVAAEKPEVEKPRIKKPSESSVLLRKLLPGLVEERRASERLQIQVEEDEIIGLDTVQNYSEQSIPLPSDIYKKFADRYHTTPEIFRKIYEKKMRRYVGASKDKARVLQSQAFYEIAKKMANTDVNKQFNEQELSETIVLLNGKKIAPKSARKNIDPLVKIGLVKLSADLYSINKKFLEED